MPTIIERIQDLVSASVHDMLNKAEDPEKMADEYLRQLNDQFYQAKTEVASAMADETRLEQKWVEAKTEVARYTTLAENALRSGKEDIARQALQKKVQGQKLAEQYEQQYQAQEEQVDALQEGLATLEARIAETQAQRDLIVAKKHRAHSLETLQATARSIGRVTALDKMEQLEGQVDDRLAQAEAMSELEKSTLESQVGDIETQSAVDSEMEELKKKLGMS